MRAAVAVAVTFPKAVLIYDWMLIQTVNAEVKQGTAFFLVLYSPFRSNGRHI